MIAPILIIGIGNPSRGDDALGPLLIERLEARALIDVALADVELLSDFQLQVEFVLDLQGRETVVFVDACLSKSLEPFSWEAALPEQDHSYSSHALSPQALLAACQRLEGRYPANAFVLAIRGDEFELGAALSAAASENLAKATDFLVGWLAGSRPNY